MKFKYYPQQTLPFSDLPPLGETTSQQSEPERKAAQNSRSSIGSILEHKDPTLLFMTMAVTMTAKNEMPMVRPYAGKIPSDIRGIHRLAPKRLFHIAPHFFFDDDRIKEYWNKPFETAKTLSNFEVSIGLDFSMTNEMTFPQKINASFLNKLWAAWLQSRGLKVIPNISFPDEWELDYWLEGWPKHSVIAINSVGVIQHGNPGEWLKAVARIREELKPLHILRYGSVIPGENKDNCTYFTNDNNRSAYGWK